MRWDRQATIRRAALAALFCTAAPGALAQTISTARTQGSGISQEQALALTARLDALERRNDELEAQVDSLRAKVAQGDQAIRQEVHSAPKVSLPGGRPQFTSADGRFSASLRGVMQLDAADYDQRDPGPVATDLRRSGPALGASSSNVDLAHARNLKAGDVFRRARIGIDGTAFGDWDYRLLFDFGGAGVENAGQVYETWIQYNGFRPGHIRIGAFPPSLGLEDQGSTNGMPFLERPIASSVARNLAGGDTRTAAQLFGYGDHWLAAAAVTGRTVGVINTGTGTGTAQTYGDQLGFTYRLAGTPLHGRNWLVHLGGHGSYVEQPPNTSGPGTNGLTPISAEVVSFSDAPEIRVDSTKLINTGNIPTRHAETAGGEFAAQFGGLLLQSEYEYMGVQRSDGVADPHFSGYYVAGIWTLTGEARRYNAQTAAFDAPAVARPFSFGGGGTGALELAVRYSETNLNYEPGTAGTLQTGASIRGGEEQNLDAGLNWYPTTLTKIMLHYQHVRVDRLSPAISASTAGTLWLTPPGAQIGQTFNVWSVRTQFAF